MVKLILQMQVSADGFVGSMEANAWTLWDWGRNNHWDEQLKADFNAHFDRIDTILLSRKMAEEGYLPHWGDAAKRHPADPFYAFAKRVMEMRKVILTDKLGASSWERTQVRSGDLAREVGLLKAQQERDIGVFGGAGFASALIQAGLVDEFQFYVNPAVLGDGVRLFETSGFLQLRLLQAKAYQSGMVVSRYAPAA